MSHTDKDRPYWVRICDPHENRDFDHSHYFSRYWGFGKPVYKQVAAKDENGNKLYETRTNSYYVYLAPGETKYGVTNPYPVTAPFLVTRDWTYPVKVQKLVGFVPDHCVVYENPNHSDYRDPTVHTCSHDLLLTKRNRPEKVYRRFYHKSARNRERADLIVARKMFNGGDNVDGYDTEGLNARRTFHKDWWD